MLCPKNRAVVSHFHQVIGGASFPQPIKLIAMRIAVMRPGLH